MNQIPPLHLLGTISKTHGIKGGVVLRSEEDLPEDLYKKELVFIKFDNLPVPFFIQDIDLTSPQSALLHFKSIGSPVKPEELPGKQVYEAETRKKKKNSPENLAMLTGFLVIDKKKGELGRVEEIIGIEKNPLLRILHHRDEILIPLQEPIIQSIDVKAKKIFIQAPDGLIDLFLH